MFTNIIASDLPEFETMRNSIVTPDYDIDIQNFQEHLNNRATRETAFDFFANSPELFIFDQLSLAWYQSIYSSWDKLLSGQLSLNDLSLENKRLLNLLQSNKEEEELTHIEEEQIEEEENIDSLLREYEMSNFTNFQDYLEYLIPDTNLEKELTYVEEEQIEEEKHIDNLFNEYETSNFTNFQDYLEYLIPDTNFEKELSYIEEEHIEEEYALKKEEEQIDNLFNEYKTSNFSNIQNFLEYLIPDTNLEKELTYIEEEYTHKEKENAYIDNLLKEYETSNFTNLQDFLEYLIPDTNLEKEKLKRYEW